MIGSRDAAQHPHVEVLGLLHLDVERDAPGVAAMRDQGVGAGLEVDPERLPWPSFRDVTTEPPWRISTMPGWRTLL